MATETISLEPNWPELFKQMQQEIRPAYDSLLRGITNGDNATGLVGRLNRLLYPITIAAQTITAPAEREQFNQALSDILAHVNETYRDRLEEEED